MKIRSLFIVVLSLFSFVVSAQDTVSSIVKPETAHLAGQPQYYRVTLRDSVSNKRVVNEFAVTKIQKSELRTKKGESVLPESGDWAISIDGGTFLKYIGNIIGSGGTNNAPAFNFLSGNQLIVGKYFIDCEKAYRMGLRLGLSSNSNTSKVSTIPYVSPTVYVNDVVTTSATNIGLTFGKEWRKGKTRLQGFYGVEGGLAFAASGSSYTYGNNLSPNNPWSRQTEYRSGTSFGLGVRGFLGAEYFIFPKISIGGEFGWGAVFRTVGEGSFKSQYWDVNTVKTTIAPIGGLTSFGFDSDNLSSVFGSAGTIRLTLHF